MCHVRLISLQESSVDNNIILCLDVREMANPFNAIHSAVPMELNEIGCSGVESSNNVVEIFVRASENHSRAGGTKNEGSQTEVLYVQPGSDYQIYRPAASGIARASNVTLDEGI
ncbi:hypothetical protein HZH68_004694 [Vespula germanica]|uniref:Uncharacterized protein n=1 Tax=Vespula germanica TaxID=30212 RepID=A0A834NK02_VESGE|nr:hypothetical protein HZH68_004694 [Vespula germanica]